MQLPPVVRAAIETIRDSRAEANARYLDKRRMQWFNFAVYVGSLIISAVLVFGLSIFDGLEDVASWWRTVLTVISILSGFMITSMIFTGKVDVARTLNLEQLREVTQKLNFLLLFQLATLANSLICAFVTLIVCGLSKDSAQLDDLTWIALALFIVTIIKTSFVPLQIFEIHRFTHAALIAEKIEEIEQAIERG